MKLTLIANFKSYKTAPDIKEWLAVVNKDPLSSSASLNLIVALPFPYLHLARSASHLHLAAQDVSPFPPGSYTGAVNAHQLQEHGVRYCLLGHSERRKYFRESNQDVANKIDSLLLKDITPVVCLDDANIRQQLTLLDNKIFSRCLFVYEPTTSIGTGKPADPEQVQETASFITSFTNRPVFYGGSIDALNASTYTHLPAINGLLIGKHSLDPQSFISIVQAVQ